MNIFRIITIGFVGIVSMISVSCSDNSDPEYIERPKKERQDIILTRSEQDIVDSHAKFAFDFFKEFNNRKSEKESENKDKNIVVSPLSVAINLSILANAMDDEMYGEFLNLMGIDPNTTRTEMNDLCRHLVDDLLAVDSQVELILANSIWAKSGFTFKDEFVNEVIDKYSAEIQNVNFHSVDSEKIINGWAKESTGGLINKIFEHFKSPYEDTIMTIYNIMCFNGEWAYKFNADQTIDGDFTNLDGSVSKVKMMCGKTASYGVNDDNRSVVSVPFGNHAYSMYFILPDEGQDFDKNISELDYDSWLRYKEYLAISMVRMVIPKFDITCASNLADTFVNMGLSWGGGDNPALTNVFTEPIYPLIGMGQVCNIKLTENGVKTTTTTIQSSDLYISPSPVRELVLNRPFMFIIEEKSTGAILYMGKITNL